MQHLHVRTPFKGETVRFRDETGMVEQPTKRHIKALGKTPDHWFGNNKIDRAGSTLVHQDCFFLPMRDAEQNDKLVISTYRPGYLPDLELNELVMCYLQYTTTDFDHTRAARWTTLDLWTDASKDYIVRVLGSSDRWETVKKFKGILDLSAEFATPNWHDGAIGASGIDIYRIDQLIVDPDGHEFYHPIEHDPRLRVDELPKEYRGRLVLPQ